MTLENQCVSLELAKEMKELGFKQESLFWWVEPRPSSGRNKWEIIDCQDTHVKENYSAYTVAELGEMLPMSLTAEQMGNAPEYGEMYLEMWHDSYGWRLTYRNDNEQSILEEPIEADTEVNARAKMLCYLKKNNLI